MLPLRGGTKVAGSQLLSVCAAVGVLTPCPHAAILAVQRTAGSGNGQLWSQPAPWPVQAATEWGLRLKGQTTFSVQSNPGLLQPWCSQHVDRSLGLAWGWPSDAHLSRWPTRQASPRPAQMPHLNSPRVLSFGIT